MLMMLRWNSAKLFPLFRLQPKPSKNSTKLISQKSRVSLPLQMQSEWYWKLFASCLEKKEIGTVRKKS